MIQSQSVENPIYKIQRKQFLKKSSIEKDPTRHLNPLLKRSKNAKERSVSSRKNERYQPAIRNAAVQTDQTIDCCSEQAIDGFGEQMRRLRAEKQELAKQLILRESQLLQLKLKHIDLKQKYESVLKNNSNGKHDNSYDFGDISNISVTNSTGSKNIKSMELSALKQRLQNIKIDKLLSNGESSITKSKVLPTEV